MGFPNLFVGNAACGRTFHTSDSVKSAFDSAVHWMLTTCGDDIGMTDRRWRRIIRSRGWKAADAFSVIMPNTYTLMKGFDVDDENTAARKLNAMPGASKSDSGTRISDAGAAPLPLLVRGAWPRIKAL